MPLMACRGPDHVELCEEYPGHSGLVWTSASDEFYPRHSAEVVEAKGEITVTFTMPQRKY